MTEEATIRRGARNARYTTVPNHVFEDARLSMEARWLLGYLLSKPDGWVVRLGDIRKKGGCGRDKARAMVAELVDAGYAEKEAARKDGKFNGLSVVIYDEPQGSVASLPQPEKPATVLPATANPPLVKTEGLATPENSIERERERDPEDRKAVEKTFERAWQAWPTSVSDSRPAGLKAWMALQPDERAAAFDEMARWLEANRASGRKHVPAFGSYLADKRWENLPPPQAETVPTAIDGKPFGPWWMAARLKQLLAGPTMHLAGLTMFERSMVESGKASADELMRQKIAKSGFPIINAMHDRAASRQGVTVSVTLQPLADMMEAVPVGSDRYAEWQVEHELRGWPWLPDPGDQRVVFFPTGGPGALDAFEQAIRGNQNDAGQREAAE